MLNLKLGQGWDKKLELEFGWGLEIGLGLGRGLEIGLGLGFRFDGGRVRVIVEIEKENWEN